MSSPVLYCILVYIFLAGLTAEMNWRINKFLIFLGDIAIVIIALCLAVAIRKPLQFSFPYFLYVLKYFIIPFPLWFLVYYTLGLYDIRHFSRTENLIREGIISFFVNSLLSVLVFYSVYYKSSAVTPKTILLLTVMITTVFIILWRRLWAKYLLVKVLNEKIAFWGSNRLIEKLKSDLKQKPNLGFTVVDMPPANKALNLIVLNTDEIKKNSDKANDIISFAVNHNVAVMSHLDFYETIHYKIPPEYAANRLWLFHNVLKTHDRFYLFLKEKLEIITAVFLLIILLPLFLAVIVLLLLINRSRPFYVQTRAGYLDKSFKIMKFRTMHPKSDNLGPLFKTEGKDKRVTLLGRFLRRFRLDELPQLINVAKGEMSLIGPRPEWVDEVKVLKQKIPHYYLRHLVKPGITGWAQVNFKATNNPDESLEKLRYDLYYVKNISFILDIRIILRTIKRIFTREKSYFIT
jgi:lipopolysaccharide/colanic/teichoic acid biosynthesis glycosyltransferase